MASRTFKIFRLNDEQLISGLDAIAKAIGSYPDPLAVYFGESGQHALSAQLRDYKTDSLLSEIFKAQSRLLLTINANFSSLGVSFHIARKDPFDEVTISFPNDSPERFVKLFAAASKEFNPIDSAVGIERLLGKELTEFYQRREEGLLRLEGLTQKLIEQNEEYRRRLDKEMEDRRNELQREQETEKKQLAASQLEKEDSLKSREQQLEERAKLLDDRSSRHARRALRETLKKSLEERGKSFQLSKATNTKRLPLHILFTLLILLPSLAFIRSLTVDPTQEQLNSWWAWYYVLRPALSGIAAAAAVIFYIRWNNDWFHQHAHEEFRLKRLDLDIDRASWVVENALEWKDEKGSEIPPELIDRLSRNLFSDSYNESTQPKHPSEDLASALLGASTSLSMKIPGVGDAILDRKGIKNFKKVAQEKGTE